MFLKEVVKRKKRVTEYLLSEEYQKLFSPPILPEDVYKAVIGEEKTRNGVWHCYIRRGGKALRPAVLLFSCGAVGGDEEKAVPAAAAVEVWHTFTLVHDDIIDRDALRRHEKTVHEFFFDVGKNRGMPDKEAKHYGISLGIVAGDLLNGWAKILLDDLYTKRGVDADVVLALIRDLEGYVTLSLSAGEARDVFFETRPIGEIGIDDIVEMLRQKTAVLYEFAGRAGAMIGLDTKDRNHRLVKLIADITCKCGIAFQLQDDILGVTGETEKMGKPVGSDILQGKRTTVVRYAWENANNKQRERVEYLLALRGHLTKRQLQETTTLLKKLGGIYKTKKLARKYVDEAAELLTKVPSTARSRRYLYLLQSWVDFMVNREF